MNRPPNPVPRLNLAPKRKRPLSLWNPLDYLLLLYWVFFFPQALRWYIKKFSNNELLEFLEVSQNNENEKYFDSGRFLITIFLKEQWMDLRRNSIIFRLFFQGLILSVFIPLILGIVYQGIDFLQNWFYLFFSVFWVFLYFLVYFLRFTDNSKIDYHVVYGVVFSTASSIAFGVTLGPVPLWFSSATFGIAFGISNSLILNANTLEINNTINIKKKIISVLFVAFFAWMLISFSLGIPQQIIKSLLLFLIYLFANIIFTFRPETWLIDLLLRLIFISKESWIFSKTSIIPIPFLSKRLIKWLEQDWDTAFNNIIDLVEYTLQFITIKQAIKKVLCKTNTDKIILRVAQIAQSPCSWILQSLAKVPEKKQLLSKIQTKPPESIIYIAAGFHCLQEAAHLYSYWGFYEEDDIITFLESSVENFTKIRFLPDGEEILSLSKSFLNLYCSTEIDLISKMELCSIPKNSILTPRTWEYIANLQKVIQEVKLVQHSVSRAARSYALNRALGELTKLLDKINKQKNTEAILIRGVAQLWQSILLEIAQDLGEVSVTKPVQNPYIVGDPVQGQLFVGREDIIRELEELWILGNQLQSVVIFGHRRMGKTSILLNISNCLGSKIKIAYVNLLCLGNVTQGVGEVLMAICDAISDTLKLPPPDDHSLLTLPERTFERYLKQIASNCSEGLIIALDEFEKIEELIEAKKIPKDFMGFLRGMVQKSPKIAFAFAGLHTLEEMTADYFQPFFASVIPIKVSFLGKAATGILLANPNEDFLLDYHPETLDLIYELTFGQPYLVQLIGFQLVRRYNDQVFETGRPRDPVFTIEDVEVVVNDPEFYQRGRYYFDGVWGQATQEIAGQHEIIKTIALHPQGISFNTLAQTTNLDETHLQDILTVLKRHDVVTEKQGHWCITVELFRRWVLQQ